MIGIGIIGAGHFGAVHARAITEVAGLEIVAVCREDQQQAEVFAREYGGKAYSDWQVLLEDPDVDAVVIATPHHLHKEIALGAARAGKHILLEKPMAPTVADCDEIAHAVSEAGVQFMVGHVMHFALPCLMAKEIIRSGTIGLPAIGTSGMIKLWMEGNRRPWHLHRETGGGMLMTAGIHALDRLVWLMGQDVIGVTAMMGSKFHQQQADDTALIGLRFSDGAIGQVQSIGYRDGGPSFAMDLVCERGALRIDFSSGLWLGRNGTFERIPDSLEPEWMHRAVVREWEAMCAAILDQAAPPVSANDARQIVAIIEAAYRANDERTEVEIAYDR